MNCSRFEEEIALYIEGDLPETETRALEEHLAGCADCRVLAAELRSSQEAVRALRDEPLDRAALAEVRAGVLARIARRSRFGWARWAYAVAAGLAMLVLALSVVRRPSEKPPAPRRVVIAEQAEPVPPAPVERRRVAHRRSARPRLRPRPAPAAPAEPLVVKLVTDDPNVVIYWIIDNKEGD